MVVVLEGYRESIEMEVIAKKKYKIQNTKYNGVRDIREISVRDI
jgi:hypothetical protein